LEGIRNISETKSNENPSAKLASAGPGGDGAGMVDDPVTLRLRLLFGDRLVFGPGKGELLARIAETGSIAAAGRAMGMSYKRAWALVEEMNAVFRSPLVQSARGGAGGGGATLTEDGREVLSAYRAMLAAVDLAAAPEVVRIAALLSDMSTGK
jgi:molybdate transport system regulatory protein